MDDRLTLQKALDEGRLEDFIAQAEAEGIGPISEAEFNDTASKVIKTPLLGDQTSSSPRRDGSREK